MVLNEKSLDKKAVSNLRFLSATAITNAGSGHTGISLGSAPIFYSIFKSGLKYSPCDPAFFNRDRLVLCAGHATAIYYSCLHAFGYDISMEDLKHFRKMGSKTPSHPEVNISIGVESASGPLGQGIPMGVGMAIAEKKLSARFNKPDCQIINHHTIVFASDGSIMEGVANEALSMAGNLGLNKLIVVYDSNNLTIEGNTNLTMNENILLGVQAQGWNTIEVSNGENIEEIESAIKIAKTSVSKPTLIKVNTHLGFGSPLENNEEIHGRALSKEELLETKKNLGMSCGEFEIESQLKPYFEKMVQEHCSIIEKEKREVVTKYKKLYPKEYEELTRWLYDYYSKKLDFEHIEKQSKDEATRDSGGVVLKEIAKQLPNLITGSADLGPSTKVYLKERGDFSAKNPLGNNIHFGLREHAMSAICNGIMLHGGFRVVCSTYMVFSDYMRHAIRMSAIMNLNVIYVLTHDSITVGTDGKTHQPVEYNAIYRSTPNLNFFRPADREETLISYKNAFKDHKPTILALSRNNLTFTGKTNKNAEYGAYFVIKHKHPNAVIFTSGSELNMCIEASEELKKENIFVDVVSVLNVDKFFSQKKAYVDEVLEKDIKLRVAVEASKDDGWYRFVGLDGVVLGVNDFGFTASTDELYKHFNLTKTDIKKTIKKMI